MRRQRNTQQMKEQGKNPPDQKKKKEKKRKKHLGLKSFCTAKKTIKKTKRPPTEWEKIFSKGILNKGLISKIYKKLICQHQKNKQLD